jgi:lipopolysaccharide export system protein LptA
MEGTMEIMVGDVVVLQGEQNLMAPAVVAYRRRVQNNQDKRANLTMEIMVGDVVVLQGEQNLMAPAGVAYRRRVQNNQDKRANLRTSQACM